MGLGQQLIWGSGFLAICLILHVSFLGACAQALPRLGPRLRRMHRSLQTATLLLFTLLMMVLAVTIQAWIWAAVYVGFDILQDWNTAIYFSMVTFTSLGYGDIVLGPDVRVFATFGSVTGLFSFGLSAAFLVSVTSTIYKFVASDHNKGENSRATGAP